jgi:HPt (histidine-containing phosphotransfer) domain-containing protein
MSDSTRPTAGLRLKFILALSLVGLLSVSAFGLLSSLIASQEGNAPTINVSGRQRMLSQRIAKFALRFSTAEDAAEREFARAQLSDAITLMETSHEALTHGNESMGIPAGLSPAMQEMYFGDHDPLDSMVAGYLKHAKTIAAKESLDPADPDLRAVVAYAQKPLLGRLNEAVKQYEVESNEAVATMEDIELGIMLATLCLLILEGVFIFRPMERHLVRQFEEITASKDRLQKRERAMQLILDSTGDAMVSVTADGVLLPERSAALQAWFGTPKEGADLSEFLYGDSGESDPIMMSMGFEQISMGILPPDVAIAQMPDTLERGDKIYSIAYRPTDGPDGQVRSVLVVFSDITAERQRERAEREMKEVYAVVRRMMGDRRGFELFLEEAGRLVSSLSAQASDKPKLLRTLHTLKGNAAVYGLGILAETVHAAESRLIANEETDVETRVIEDVFQGWQASVSRLESFLERNSEQDTIELLRSEYDDHVDHLRSRDEFNELLPIVARWTQERVEAPCKDVLSLAERIAERQEKQLEVVLRGGEHRLPRERFDGFWRSLVHVARNAVDHGLEPPAQRIAANKPASGRIELEVAVSDDEIRVSFEDDGRGIDWGRIGAKARDAGLPFQSHEDRVAALFASGISTADVVTDLSGRGVGASAVLESVQAIGGHARITTSAGRGTRFDFTFPNPGETGLAA